MANQLALVFPAGSQPRDTSEAAAASLGPDYLARIRREVLGMFRSAGDRGFTADEVAFWFDHPRPTTHNHTSPRITELAQLGYLERTSRRRQTRSGRSAAVYVITGHGNRALP